ncbi:MAG: glycosyltransferase family 4 protein [Planctomycetaceae bacterium]|jgi:glycosyltransferase involved in cell wall biosynthesis|nr:glycosyltransferase family 4 protein [Planctomycetaceae bacterium]
MNILHLTASPFFGGPERVILDIIKTQRDPSYSITSYVATFNENGNCEPFLEQLRRVGFDGIRLRNDMPHLVAAARELRLIIRECNIDIVCAHGHKSRIVGWYASRRAGIPIIGVSHGWTWQDWKTSIYERIDQWFHRRMNAVVCVSQGQADKVIKTGTPSSRVVVIHNAIDTKRFDNQPDPSYMRQLESYFSEPPKLIVGAAGRLSPEKGYDVLIKATVLIKQRRPELDFGVVLFGEGFLRTKLQEQIDNNKIADTFKMVGFTSELDKFMPHFDIFAQSSHTEGFPTVNIEAMAAKVPVAATAVGGVPEQIISGETGILTEPNNAEALSIAIEKLLTEPETRQKYAAQALIKATTEFTCQNMAGQYKTLFEQQIKIQ